jgi:hypothetical protein
MTACNWDNSIFVASPINMRGRINDVLINFADYLFFYAAA